MPPLPRAHGEQPELPFPTQQERKTGQPRRSTQEWQPRVVEDVADTARPQARVCRVQCAAQRKAHYGQAKRARAPESRAESKPLLLDSQKQGRKELRSRPDGAQHRLTKSLKPVPLWMFSAADGRHPRLLRPSQESPPAIPEAVRQPGPGLAHRGA
jgi:hypothetical protein